MSNLIPTRKAFGEELLALGRERQDFIVLDADISKSMTTNLFSAEFPERAYNLGIAEQNMVAVAAGYASTGKTVFTATYGVFMSMRACEQIRTFVCYPGLNVKFISSHAGLQVGSDGATHQAIEDVGIMRSIPNMTVIQPSDAVSARKAARAVIDYNGPVYIRLLRNPSPVFFDDNYEFEIGKAVRVLDYGTDLTIIASGAMVQKAMEAAENLKTENINVRLLEIHTLKPIDSNALVTAAKETGGIVTVEDHNRFGGLGSAVAEVLSEKFPAKLKILAINDTFGESGSPEELYDHYHLNTSDIVQAVKEMKE